ncbi:hypothetical protein MIMGU_mgv1a020787mg, partial [Erythranthe guttata]
VLNGLLIGEDWENAIKIPLGVVPAGTGNGMVKSLLDSCGEPCAASNATMSIIRGINYNHTHKSCPGTFLLLFQGLQRIFGLRKYNGSIIFVPASGFESYGEPIDVEKEDYGYQGPKVDIKSLNWHKINGPFVSIWLHNVPWGGEDTMAAPDARFSDGCLDLIMIKDCPKLSLLMLMNGLNDGSHVKSPHVSYLKVKAFILQPGPRVDDQAKSEEKTLMSYDKPLIKVDQGLATLFASSLDLADLIPIPRD